MHRLVPNTARFQVPALASISLPPKLTYSTCFSPFSDLRHPNVSSSLWYEVPAAGYHKFSPPHSSFDPHKGITYTFGTVLLYISIAQLA